MMNVTFRHIALKMAGLLRPASILLLSALTALAVLSCGGSDDDATPEPPLPQPEADTPIVFSGSLSEDKSESHARTRATIAPLSDTHQTFYVWGYKNLNATTTENVMQSYTVNYVSGSAGTTTTNSSGWEYVNQQPTNGTEQSIKYWDFTASDYRFFGYAGNGVTVDDTSLPTSVDFSFDVNATTANLETLTATTPLYSKLWYNTGEAISDNIQPVQLVFLQPYVKVRFLFRQSESPETIFTLSGITFGPTTPDPPAVAKTIALTGTFTVTYPLSGITTKEETWAVAPTSPGTADTDYLTAFTEDYYVFVEDAFNREDVPATQAGEKKWYIVLPAKNQGTYTLTVFVNGEERNVVVPAQYMNWQPGYEYTYVFKITERGTVELEGLQAAFVPWYTDDVEHPIHNW